MIEWPRVGLDELADRIDYGLTASAATDRVGPKFLRITDIQNGAVNWTTVPYCNCRARELDRYSLSVGDIVFARTGATTGKSYLIRECPPNTVFASYLIRIRPNTRVHPQYLAYFFDTPDYWGQVALRAQGAGQPGINASKLKELSVPLPPLSEQKRIAAILDQADAIRRKRRQAIDEAAGLRLSMFYELFGAPFANRHGWKQSRIDQCANVQGGIALSSFRNGYALQLPYLRVANVFRDSLNLHEIKTIGVTESEFERTQLRLGDILVVEGHGNPEEIGRCAVWDASISPCLHQNHLIRVRPDTTKARSNFLSTFLNSPEGRRQLIRAGKTTSGLNTISLSNVRATVVEIPPLQLQQRYEEALQRSKSIGDATQRACAVASELFDSLIHLAFGGQV
jgi:type I restriction enzyme, S subunit